MPIRSTTSRTCVGYRRSIYGARSSIVPPCGRPGPGTPGPANQSKALPGSALDIFHPGGPPPADRKTSAGRVAVASDRDMKDARWGPRPGRALTWLASVFLARFARLTSARHQPRDAFDVVLGLWERGYRAVLRHGGRPGVVARDRQRDVAA